MSPSLTDHFADLRALLRPLIRWMRALGLPVVRFAFVASLGVLLWSVLLGVFTVKIEPGTAGVRLAPFGSGIDPRDHGPGRHFTAPGLWRWIRLDTATRFAWFQRRTGDPLEIRTADDNPATLDLVVAYRVLPGRAHELVREGRNGQVDERLRANVRDVLRAELASLTSEDWFDPDRRGARIEEARVLLNATCAADLVEVRELRLHDISFTTEFETKLGEKQIAHQQQRRLEARSVSERAAVELTEHRAEIDREIELIRARAKKERSTELAAHHLELARISSRAEAYQSETRAAADAAFDAAVAEGKAQLSAIREAGERERLAALAGEGGEAWLAVRAARSLDLREVVLEPERFEGELRELVERLTVPR